MNVLIIGSGGREHAICVSCKKSTEVNQIFCMPGNAGTEQISKNVLIDLDNFKRINDQFGHQVGDHVLYVTAKLLESVVMDDGIVARWGGEEFAVLLPHIAIQRAQHIAETLRQRLEMASFDDPAIQVTMSVGVPQLLLGENGMSLLKRTDAAMYQAKNMGRNQVIVNTGPDEKGIS